MSIRDFVSDLFHYRTPHGDTGWDEMASVLGRTGQWSITGSPKKFQDMILDLMKRVERLEEHEKILKKTVRRRR